MAVSDFLRLEKFQTLKIWILVYRIWTKCQISYMLSVMSKLPKIIVICGPTATGKSDLAVNIALHLKNAEIISADSRQVFRHLDIGTGKITKEEMKGVHHHMLDVVDPMEEFSVFAYAEMAEKIISDIHKRESIPILCGGTGLYIDAILTGNKGAPVSANPKLREELGHKPVEELREMLVKIAEENKADISKIDIKNKRRIIRAIEIIRDLGHVPLKNTKPLYDAVMVGLDAPSDTVQRRISKRLDTRLDAGMIEESQNLLNKKLITHDQMFRLGLEYRYISLLLQKKIAEDEFKAQLGTAIWQYAKRQRTWFKRDAGIRWFDSSNLDMKMILKLL